MNGAVQFQKVLEKYSLVWPVSPEDQRYIVKSRRRLLKAVLRRQGAYGAAFGFVVLVAVALRNLGFKLSIVQAKIAAAVLATTIAAGTAPAAYYGGKIVYKKAAEAISAPEKSSEKSESTDSTDILLKVRPDQKPARPITPKPDAPKERPDESAMPMKDIPSF